MSKVNRRELATKNYSISKYVNFASQFFSPENFQSFCVYCHKNPYASDDLIKKFDNVLWKSPLALIWHLYEYHKDSSGFDLAYKAYKSNNPLKLACLIIKKDMFPLGDCPLCPNTSNINILNITNFWVHLKQEHNISPEILNAFNEYVETHSENVCKDCWKMFILNVYALRSSLMRHIRTKH